MGLFSWFSERSKPKLVLNTASSRIEPTQPFGRTQHPPTGQVSAARAPSSAAGGRESGLEQRKNARYMRRELLYGVVRESMIRCGVLSAGYKFKALALDPRGLQFMVMVDLAPDFGNNSERWREIESMISDSAKTRHGIVVTGVYWRVSNLVPAQAAAGMRQAAAQPVAAPSNAPSSLAGAASAGASAGMAAVAASAALAAAGRQNVAPRGPQLDGRGPISRPMPLFPEGPDDEAHAEIPADGGAAPLDLSIDDAEKSRRLSPGLGRFEPIDADEVEAFKRALAAGAALDPSQGPDPARAQPALAAVVRPKVAQVPTSSKPNDNYTLLTGFEDTEAVDPDFAPPALGTTQYGELR